MNLNSFKYVFLCGLLFSGVAKADLADVKNHYIVWISAAAPTCVKTGVTAVMSNKYLPVFNMLSKPENMRTQAEVQYAASYLEEMGTADFVEKSTCLPASGVKSPKYLITKKLQKNDQVLFVFDANGYELTVDARYVKVSTEVVQRVVARELPSSTNPLDAQLYDYSIKRDKFLFAAKQWRAEGKTAGAENFEKMAATMESHMNELVKKGAKMPQ